MIVQCDRCGQRARINEEKLPPQGGKIRCPSCENVIIVKPQAAAAPSAPQRPRTARSSTAGAVAASRAAPEEAAAPAAPAAEPPAPAPAAAEPARKEAGVEASTWKLRVSGLTYSFQTLESLQQWLQGRDKLDGIRVARDGDDWKELGDYPDVLTDQLALRFFPAGNVPKSATSGGGSSDGDDAAASSSSSSSSDNPARSSTPDLRRPRQGRRPNSGRSTGNLSGMRPPQQGKRGSEGGRSGRPRAAVERSSRAGVLLVALLVLVVAGIGLNAAGVIDLGGLVPGLGSGAASESLKPAPGGAAAERSGKPRQGGTTAGATPDDDGATVHYETSGAGATAEASGAEDARIDEELARAEREKRDKSLSAARSLIGDKRFAEARAILEPQARLWPEHLELNETLLEVYTRLDLRKEQGEQRELVKVLREKLAEAEPPEGSARNQPESP